jgi:predicted SAM-dependent methyltransferase
MFDAILCISVLEHLAMEEILVVLSEVFRVLKPGGLFILTFDIRLDSKTGNSLNIGYTHRILEYLGKTFAQDLSKVQRDVNALSSFHNTGLFLTTDWIRQEYPKLLPWKLSMRGVIKQISRLHWPSRPFESLGVCCLALERP